MSAVNKYLLQKSFMLATACEADLIAHFYRLLFGRHPEIRPLFHRRPQEERERLVVGALGQALQVIDSDQGLSELLGPLARSHREYGVEPHMYQWVADAFVATLGHVLGTTWTADLRQMWFEAFERINREMLAGGER